MTWYLIAAFGIVVVSLLARKLLAKSQAENTGPATEYKHGLASKLAAEARADYTASRLSFGKAEPVVQFAMGLILSVCFVFAAHTALGVYGWIFQGLGWTKSSAAAFAVVPFIVVFVAAYIIKLFVWKPAKSFLFGDKSENAFGHIVATLAALVIFTGVVFQLAPFASVRSELVMGRQVTAAQEEVAFIEAECAVEAPAADCEARLATAEEAVVKAEERLAKGREVDETMAKIVPFAEMLTAFGPIILIEVLAMVTLPLMRARRAEKKRDKLGLRLASSQVQVISVVEKEPVKELAGS